MRALCGAIIAAAALVGPGLTAIGIGTRYQTRLPPDLNAVPLPLPSRDGPLVFAVVSFPAMAVIGLGIAFLGLAYHHHRRVHEMTRHNGAVTTHTHTVT